MTYIPTQNGFMNLEDSEKLLRLIFPNYPSLEPCHPGPRLNRPTKAAQIGAISHVPDHCCNLPCLHIWRSSYHGSYEPRKRSVAAPQAASALMCGSSRANMFATLFVQEFAKHCNCEGRRRKLWHAQPLLSATSET